MLKKIFSLVLVVLSLSGCMSFSDSLSENGQPTPVFSVPLYGETQAANTITSQVYPQQITLLVPLQGQLASSGQAIRDGFMMAYQSAAENARPTQINVIDSSDSTQIQIIYAQAVQQGTNFVIGPLAKPQVQALAQTNTISVPTLTLNYLDNNQNGAEKLYQFGLSPLDEARQAAQLARRDNKQNAIIIVPEGNWGQSVANAFRDEWQQQGRAIIATIALSNSQPVLVQQIKRLAIQQRGKFDIIFLAAPPTVARQIKPLLKFYNINNIPIYATSTIYSGTSQSRLDNDLNGIIFCDAPWALETQGPDANTKQKLAATYPNDFQYRAKLYGLGVDAYHIAVQFKQMTTAQQKLVGATGTLFFNNHRIVRQLTCAQFREGVPVLLTLE